MIRQIVLVVAILQLWTPGCEAANVTGIRVVTQNGVPTTQSGYVQVQIDGIDVWGSICDDGFDNNDAFVVCRQLGFRNGGTFELEKAFPTGAEQVFFVDDTICSGDEPTLTECTTAQQTDCIPGTDEIVVISCTDNSGPGQPTVRPPTTTTVVPDIITGICKTGTNPNPNVRLSGRDTVPWMGFVEVKNPNTNQWGYVCDDFWDSNAAKVVCRELCFDTTAYIPKPGVPAEYAVYPSNPNIIRDNVRCDGTELSLISCPANAWGTENCKNDELAGVQCQAADFEPPPPPIPILFCREGLMIARFSITADPGLEEKHLVVYHNDVPCGDVTKSTSTSENLVTIQIPVDKCGTQTRETNASYIVYTNRVTYLPTGTEGVITRKNTYQVDITCSLPTGIRITQRVEPLTERVTQKAEGVFVMRMDIFRNDSFETAVTQSPVRIPLGEWLNMAVSLEDYDSNLKIVLTDCRATPTGDLSKPPTQVLIKDKCPIEPTMSIYPLSQFQMGIRFKPFKFGGHDLVYVICESLVCLNEDQSQLCDRSCKNEKPVSATGRKKRSIYNKYFEIVKSPVIIFYNPNDNDETESSLSDNEDGSVQIVQRLTTQSPAPTPVPTPAVPLVNQQQSGTHQQQQQNQEDVQSAATQPVPLVDGTVKPTTAHETNEAGKELSFGSDSELSNKPNADNSPSSQRDPPPVSGNEDNSDLVPQRGPTPPSSFGDSKGFNSAASSLESLSKFCLYFVLLLVLKAIVTKT